MTPYSEQTLAAVRAELELIWKAHKRVGLEGEMCLYTIPGKEPFRAKEEGFFYWFGPDKLDHALEEIRLHYNEGNLPNSPLLLNPIVHRVKEDGTREAIGSGVIWCTSFCLGVDTLKPDCMDRLRQVGAFTSPFARGENAAAGVKVLAFADKALPLNAEGHIDGCKALYDLANIKSDEYWKFYTLSGLSYLTKNGSFEHESFASLFTGVEAGKETEKTVSPDFLNDAAKCWDSYGRYHSLWLRFGPEISKLDENLKYFNLCARDFELFDATGPMRAGAEETFEFIVPGWLPRGAVTLIAAAGGTGKSSVAHHLCVMAAIDYEKGEEAPKWLGQPLNMQFCNGVCIYFSGEDGPAIINARGSLFDPEGRANRLMFQRTNFGEGVSFHDFIMKRLAKLPNVPILVVDPARKYLEGDEDDSDVVSKFFEAMEEFAITKNAAVVVVHHLAKGANPKSAREVLECLRGSQVFIDRPRVVIGMYRDGPYTCVGLAKNNIPPNLGMVQGERVFARDPKSLQLVWLPGSQGIKNDMLTEEELEQIKAEAELKALKAENAAAKPADTAPKATGKKKAS